MHSFDLNINDEVSRLRAVILGTATSNGPTPQLHEAYDPKSALHIRQGTYPVEADMVAEMEAVAQVLLRYDVMTFRPEVLEDTNQIFTRDIGFVIDDKFVRANILPDRMKEIDAIQHVIDKIDPSKVLTPPDEVHVEGGDVMLIPGHILVGTYRGADYSNYIIARTNVHAHTWLEKQFPNRKVISFDLAKSNTDPYANALHLDCCFQPVGSKYAITYPGGFLREDEYAWIVNHFGADNIFEVTNEEMFNMNSNIFSIAPDVVISERNFTRLNTWLRSKNITVEEVPYAEISKQEGLLRCSTLPLIRD